ncbi:type II toxin-antitoxin system death-on-curing family toxin [Rothia terrae]|uniref:type II toxin-antitoxin system death-on-curing family toxin n=1 Tax=Rothia terrae TaxID=396015 RepID=UPI0033C499D7
MRAKSLTVEQVLVLHRNILGIYDDGLLPNGEHLLESALSRPESSYGGVQLFDSTFKKAAALLEGIIQNHPFQDGNKRTAYNSAVILLRLHGYRLMCYVSDEEQADFVVSIARKQRKYDDIVRWIDRHFTKAPPLT